ncbi:LuxR C-terminal-related transcriptional regulator [Gordonia sp. OPL2]|uniref:response regulator transcription factor n=1 Tax=Gordonia sp. OPL2 TaxID=2486274 RepID=UPI00292A40B2|nr:LuxR C-terminal-related transcriptional regulator [Gordonia sp. OPL2]
MLSDREVEVLTQWLICDSKKEAAAALFISDATVNTHLARIRAKYDDAGRPAATKIALLIRAIEDGYITLNQIAQSVGGNLAATPVADVPVAPPAPSAMPMAVGSERVAPVAPVGHPGQVAQVAPVAQTGQPACRSVDSVRRDRTVRYLTPRSQPSRRA